MRLVNQFSTYYPDGYIKLVGGRSCSETALAFLILADYPKFQSLAAFSAAKLPSSDALLIFKLTPEAKIAIADFVDKRNLFKVLLRSECFGGKLGYPSRQAVPISKIIENISDLQTKGNQIIVAIQAAGNIYCNLYNLNLEITRNPSCCYLVEISGPGFTATDLNRNGTIHERIEIPIFIESISENLISRCFIIQDDQYQIQRQKKIDAHGNQRLVSESALILQHAHYTPIPLFYLMEVWADRHQILQVTDHLGYIERGAVVSLSFILRENKRVQRCYWDIHPILRKSLCSRLGSEFHNEYEGKPVNR